MSSEAESWEPMSQQELARRSALALADRRARGEIMTYELDGWMVREYPGRRIERLCLVEDFDSGKYSLPALPAFELTRRGA